MNVLELASGDFCFVLQIHCLIRTLAVLLTGLPRWREW